jgi:hypothetical protein
LRTSIDDLLVRFTSSGLQNNRIQVQSQIIELPRGSSNPRTIAESQLLSLVWDKSLPRIDLEKTAATQRVVQGESLSVYAREDLSGVEKILYSFQIDDRGGLVSPTTAWPGYQGDSRRFALPTKKLDEGEHKLYAILVDRAGNESSRYDFQVIVQPIPTTALEPEVNSIHGLVTFYSPVRGISVLLQGPVSRRTETDGNGKFRFEDLPPGEYQLIVRGRFDGSRSGERQRSVIVQPPPNEPSRVEISFRFP